MDPYDPTRPEPDSGRRLRPVALLAGVIWYGLLLLIALWILGGPVYEAARRIEGPADVRGILALAVALLWLVLVTAFFFLVAALARWSRTLRWAVPAAPPPSAAAGEPPPAAPGKAFPAPVTLIAGGWLVVAAFVSLGLLLVVLVNPPWLRALIGPSHQTDLEDLLVTMLAGAVGGCVSAMLAYLEHASEKKNFDSAYLPWYIARPLLGLLLGLVGFFVAKGGLLATVPETDGQDFNDYGLAGLGCMIGLFSKQAIEKLREIFQTIFVSRAQARGEVVERAARNLPPEVAAQVRKAVGVPPPRQPPPPEGEAPPEEPPAGAGSR